MRPENVSDAPLPAQNAEPEWPRAVARSVATQIRFWRERRAQSAQQLSDRTRDLGYHVPRSVIANIETGRRDTIGIAELFILAAALNVPATMLLTPVGRQDVVEVLPGLNVSPWLARGWIVGAVGLGHRSFSNADWQDGRRAIVLYDVHRLLLRDHQNLEARMKRLEEQLPRTVVEPQQASSARSTIVTELAAEFAYSIDRIRAQRELIRNEGLELPELPPGISSLLLETESTGRHQLG